MRQPRALGVAFAAGLCLALLAYVLLGGRFGQRAVAPHPPRLVERPVERPPTLQGTRGVEAQQGTAKQSVLRLLFLDEQDTPIAGVRVSTAPPGRVFAAAGGDPAKADASGVADLPTSILEQSLPDHALLFLASGFVPQILDIAAIQAHQAGSQALQPLRVVLRRGGQLTGHVRDPWGGPVADAEVWVLGVYGRSLALSEGSSPGPLSANDLIRARTDGRGEFVATGISTFPVTLRVHKAHYVHMAAEGQVVPSEGPVEVTLQPYARAGIRLIDGSGSPLTAFAAGVVRSSPGLEEGTYAWHSLPPDSTASGAHPESGQYWWSFRLGDTASVTDTTSILVKATAPGYADQEVSLPVRIPADPHFGTPLDVVMAPSVPESTKGTLVFEVESDMPLKSPLTAAVVRLRVWNPSGPSTIPYYWTHMSDGVGRIALPSGKYEVALEGPANWIYYRLPPKLQVVEVTAGNEVRVRWSLDYGVLRVHAKLAGGEALPFFGANIFRKKGERWVNHLHFDIEDMLYSEMFGTFRSYFVVSAGEADLPLAAGEYAISVTDSGLHSEFVPFRITAGQATEVELSARGSP